MGLLKQFNFAALAELDGGRIGIAVDRAIKRAGEDCEDLPGEKKARRVTLVLDFVPDLDQDGLCESVKASVQIKESLPTRKSKKYDLGLRRGGVMTYQPDSLENHEQDTFDFEDHK